MSPQTLIVASLASLTAAIVTSTFWQRGTPITAALTPVIVAIASELYSRPAKRITELSSRAGAVRTYRVSEQRERVSAGGPPERRPEPLRPPDEPELGPMRIYRSEQRSSPIRRVHIRAALVTAAIAFAMAAAVLTLPELVFGGSVAAHGKTTLFGGATHKHRSSTDKNNGSSSSTQTAPTTSAPAPTTTTPAPSTTTPAQTTPQTTAPTQTPAPSGSPAPQGTTAPAQSPPSG